MRWFARLRARATSRSCSRSAGSNCDGSPVCRPCRRLRRLRPRSARRRARSSERRRARSAKRAARSSSGIFRPSLMNGSPGKSEFRSFGRKDLVRSAIHEVVRMASHKSNRRAQFQTPSSRARGHASSRSRNFDAGRILHCLTIRTVSTMHQIPRGQQA